MEELFDHEIEGCFLYSRQFNPTNKYLAAALARMEDGECAQVTASGMSAISCTLLELCAAGDRLRAHGLWRDLRIVGESAGGELK